MGFLGTLFGKDQAKAAKQAAAVQSQAEAQNRALAGTTTTQSLGDLDTALSGALGQYDTLQPFAQGGQNALQMILNALGLNGTGGNQNALAAFQTGPGYQFAMDQGVNALDRSAAARGNLYSGAQAKELTGYGQGLANQEWGNWLQRLLGVAGSGQNALTTMAGSRADALLGTGMNKANVRTNGLSAISGANSNEAAARASGIVGAANAKSNALANLLTLGGTLGGAWLGKPK